jgi:hypothetical protein
MASHIERRKFLATLGGAAVWPLAASAQQDQRLRLIGWLAGGLAANNWRRSTGCPRHIRCGTMPKPVG